MNEILDQSSEILNSKKPIPCSLVLLTFLTVEQNYLNCLKLNKTIDVSVIGILKDILSFLLEVLEK